MKSSLYVIRDDGQYDYKSGFKSYEEANAYRNECQRSWMNHADYVYLIIRDENGKIAKEINLTRATEVERTKILEEASIPLK